MAIAATVAVVIASSAAANAVAVHRRELKKDCSLSYDASKCSSVCLSYDWQSSQRTDSVWTVDNTYLVSNECVPDSQPVMQTSEGLSGLSILLIAAVAIAVFVVFIKSLDY